MSHRSVSASTSSASSPPNQFRKRYERIAKARDSTLADIEASSEPAEVEDLVAEV